MKKGKIAIEHLIGLVLLLAALLILGGLIIMFYGEFDSDEMKMWSCWGSNALKSSNAIFKNLLPTTCTLIEAEEKADKAAVVKMLKDTWWMYGKGTLDYSWLISFNDEQAVFYFTAKEDITFEDFLKYLMTTRDGNPESDVEDTDYNYLQKGSKGQTICYGLKIMEHGKAKIISGNKYFIIFRDSRDKDFGDKLVITAKPMHDQEGRYFCEEPGKPPVMV